MNDFPTQIADFLEDITNRFRSMTVDRVAGWAKWLGVGIVAVTLALVLGIFLVVGLVRLLAGLVGMQWSYTIIGGLFLVIGMFLWRLRVERGASQD
jgi:hypothetical protein